MWQPIETAPKDGKLILVYDTKLPAEQYGIVAWCPVGIPCWIADDGEVHDPTHWQSLPSPPESK